MSKAYTIQAFCERYYKRVENTLIEIEYIPFEELIKTYNSNRFFSPERGEYVKQLEIGLGEFMQLPEFQPYKDLKEVSYDYFVRVVEGREGLDEYVRICQMLYQIYPIFKQKIVSMIVESEFMDSDEEVLNCLNRCKKIIGNSISQMLSQDEKNSIADALIVYFLFILNFKDVFGFEMIGLIDYFENMQHGEFTLKENIVVPGELSDRVGYILKNYPDLYIMTKHPDMLSYPKKDADMENIMAILSNLEDAYAPSVQMLTEGGCREKIVDGYIKSLICSSQGDETLYRVFTLMRKNIEAGNEVLNKLLSEQNKSLIRNRFSHYLELWMQEYTKKESLSYSKAVLATRRAGDELRRTNAAVSIESAELVSPNRYRVIFVNNDSILKEKTTGKYDFISIVNDFIKNCEGKAFIITNNLKFNQRLYENNLIRIVDIKVYP